MKVRQARTAGFCMGVRRAVELVLEEASHRPGPIVTYGPLIHNNQVLELLANKGVRVVDDLDQLTGDETAVIRAHGVPPEIKAHLRRAAGRVVDATCPRVLRVQALIRRYTALGYTALIVGDPDHAEVKGLLGHARDQGVVVSQAGQAARLADYNRVILVAQTTQSNAVFEQIVQEVKDRWPQALIFNTICPATHERQIEVRELARQVEAVVVVGGSFSANTRRLAQIAAQNQTQTFHVETETELDLAALCRLRSVGVTAGASTPNWLIRKVVEELRGLPALGQSRWRSAAFRVFRFLLKSNTLVALGGAGLALAGGLALGLKISASLLAVPFFYLYAMHTLNHFLDREATAYNDPERLRFYAKHQTFLVATSCLATLLGLVLSARLGPASFISLLALSALGLLYSIRIV
ncbi:MAG: 4-hydroxy-3-methylbut-2-enyl diphosphate reductase, partial [Deltaproteobacteria bacterium]|nr:4-hydroxy-3-methylbut-2-enyl diphosphate reductase [Deltaproteobacteria bacterium]